jgi:hypothetical protein
MKNFSTESEYIDHNQDIHRCLPSLNSCLFWIPSGQADNDISQSICLRQITPLVYPLRDKTVPFRVKMPTRQHKNNAEQTSKHDSAISTKRCQHNKNHKNVVPEVSQLSYGSHAFSVGAFCREMIGNETNYSDGENNFQGIHLYSARKNFCHQIYFCSGSDLGSFFLVANFIANKTPTMMPITIRIFITFLGSVKVENPVLAPNNKNTIKAIAAIANGPVNAPTRAVKPLLSAACV